MALGEESAEACFERAVAMLDGNDIDFAAFESRKLFNIIATPDGADVEISSAGVRVLLARTRGSFSYFAVLGPPLLSALRALAMPGSAMVPFVAQPEAMRPLGLFATPGPRKFWLTRSNTAIHVASRCGHPGDVFDNDPRPLLPWTPPPIVHANFDVPIACPHCGAHLRRARLAEGALVCSPCGRSHRAPAEQLAIARLETSPRPE